MWDEIQSKYERMAARRSPTMAMADLYEACKESASDYLRTFHVVSNQVGMAVFIDAAFAGIDILGKFGTFEKTFGKLVNSYVMDALETAHEGKTTARSSRRAITSRVLQSAMEAHVEARKSVALGVDFRLESPDLHGAGLEYDNYILQMSIFQKNGQQTRTRRSSGMASASRRSRIVH